MILTIFVSDSDSNEALQEETCEEDESEEEVATHVRQGTIKFSFHKILFLSYLLKEMKGKKQKKIKKSLLLKLKSD